MKFRDLPQGKSIVIRDENGNLFCTTGPRTAVPVKGRPGNWSTACGIAPCAATFAATAEVEIVDDGTKP